MHLPDTPAVYVTQSRMPRDCAADNEPRVLSIARYPASARRKKTRSATDREGYRRTPTATRSCDGHGGYISLVHFALRHSDESRERSSHPTPSLAQERPLGDTEIFPNTNFGVPFALGIHRQIWGPVHYLVVKRAGAKPELQKQRR